MKLQLAKGMNDTTPEEMILLQDLMDKLKKTFEKYGFVPLDTPAIERYDVLSAKYAGGNEILKETFNLTDQGGRELGLRYDLTIPFSRYVGMNPTLKLPFKRYQLGKVWRDGPMGLGRYREFWQCDVDTVGTTNMKADAEILSLANTVLEDLKLDATIYINNRKLLNGILESLNIEKKEETILILDKITKITKKEILQELEEININKETAEKLFQILNTKGTKKEKLQELKKIENENTKQGTQELEELFELLDQNQIKNYELDLYLSRGLAFYTGTIFETYLNNNEIKNAIASGGRYDKIISQFLNTKQEYPCVGISFGLSRINAAIPTKNKQTKTQVFIIKIGNVNEQEITKTLRQNNINTETDIMNRNTNKNLNYVNTKKIPYALFIGEEEEKTKKYKLKNMENGNEETLTIQQIITKLKKDNPE